MNAKFYFRPTLPCLVLFIHCIAPGAGAFQKPGREPLPDFDARAKGTGASAVLRIQREAVNQLKARATGASVDFDRITGAARFVSASGGFLTGPDGEGVSVSAAVAAAIAKADPHRATKTFLTEHRALFGHGPEVLNEARVKREFTTAHNGLKSVVWEQQVDGVPVFEAVLISHTTKRGELVNVSSQFVLEPAAADRGTPKRAALLATPPISAAQALARAAANLDEATEAGPAAAAGAAEDAPEKRQKFTAPFLRGEGEAKLIWLPTGKDTLRLCWDVLLTVRQRGELYRVLVDVQDGVVLLRRCLTDYLTNATYRVFTSDSPSPFSPGHPTPLTNQPPLIARALVTLPSLDTNASPAGWINDLVNETLGNNVDAHTDVNNDNAPDLPRPAGSPFRVFDFPLDLTTQPPGSYRDAAVVQLFYLCNWMHDKLYQLGFTEAAGNFQSNNFGRGGLGNDAVQADAQDGGGTDNANMSTPPDGSAPRMQMYVFSGPALDRDGDFDAEIVLHEYTHGLSNRRVGGGVGISALQSAGMGEGWSDWYGLTLLSEAGDNVNGNYAAGGYATYQFLSATFQQNYYYGIRRYPYSTDLTKNPLTFKDIDPAQASAHAGIPKSPVIGGGGADEVHNQGEVWCVTLWEARANLINKHGFAVGNQLILQLVTDGMNLSPANPNFLQARDAIIQADLVLTGGANRLDLWAAFAKRGMGAGATSPSSSATSGVHESFDLPDDLFIAPGTGFTGSGPVGGPFTPNTTTFILTNTGAAPLTWTMVNTTAWLNVSLAGGATLTPGGPAATVMASVNGSASSLPMGIYSGSVRFTNVTSGVGAGRSFVLRVGQPEYFTEIFDSAPNDLAYSTITFTPNGSASFYAACRETAVSFPTDPAGGNPVSLSDDSYVQVTLAGTNTVAIHNRRTNVFFIGSNGYLTFDSGDGVYDESLDRHFDRPRVSALFDDLYPPGGGTISWRELSNRVAVTYQSVPEYDTSDQNSFQIEMFFDGRIRLTWLALTAPDGLAGLSGGGGVPAGFAESDLSSFGACIPPLIVTAISGLTEGVGLVAGAGHVILSAPLTTNLTVYLTSSAPAQVTVPASIIIPAAQTNGLFDLTVIDDPDLDGTQTAVITANAPGFGGGSVVIAVHDNETAALQVGLPETVSESGGSTQGVVRVSAIPAANITVNLASSDTSGIQVPSSVIIPAGQTSAVFTATIVDNGLITGPQSVTITTHVQNWTDGTATTTVLDNESLNLIVSVPYYDYEDAGTLINAGSVQLSGTLATNLVVSLLSSDVTELTVPPTVIIPAGQSVGSFNITPVNDFLVDGEQVAQIVASAPGFVTGSGQMFIVDVQSPAAPAVIAPPDLASNVPAAGTVLQWFTVHAGVTNDVFFGTNPSPGVAELLGSTPGNSWTLPLLAPNTTYYWRIGVRNIGSNSSPVWRFKTRGLDHFDVSTVTSPQLILEPFNLTVTARDELNRAITNFAGPVALRGGARSNSILQSPLHSLVSETLNGYTYSLGYSFTPNVNITVTAVRHYFGSKISIWTDAGQLLAAQPVSSVAGTWLETPLAAPVTLLAGTRYRVACYTALDQFYWREDGPTAFPHGTIDQAFTTTGDSFPTQSSVTRWWFADLLYTVDSSRPSTLTPTNTGVFTDGVWSGSVTVTGPATNMTVQAITPTGHFGQSNPFHVVTSNQSPIILTQPASQTVLTGATVNLSVSAFGTPPLIYQWRYNDGDLAGATNATLTLANVITNQSGNYSVAVTNPLGATASSNALLTVVALPPFFDDFEPGIDLLQWSSLSPTVLATNYGGSISAVNSLWFGGDAVRLAQSRSINTTVGGVVDFYLRIADGGGWPWEHADLPGEGIVLEYSTTAGGNWVEFGRYDTTAYYQWTHVTAEIPAAAQTAGTQFRWRQLSHSGLDYDHWALDDVSVLTGPRPPSILTQPLSRTTVVGHSATFGVSASGSAPISYQWLRDGTNLANATNASYTIANAQTNDAGNYRVLVTNLYGSVLSSNAALTVLTGGVARVAVYGAPDADSYNEDVRSKLDGTGLFAQVDQFIIRPGYPVPTLGELLQYEAVLVYSDDELNNPVALGNVLADYVDVGGGVVLATFAFEDEDIDIQGRLVSGGYLPFTSGPQDQFTPLFLVPDQPPHPILAGVNTFHGGSASYHNLVSTTPGATLVAHWSNGRPLVATMQRTNGMVVGLNFYPPSSDVDSALWQATTDGARLMANALSIAGQVRALPALSFTWSNISSPQFTNVPFAVTIQARDLSGQIMTNFAGPVALRDAATGGVASNSILPAPTHLSQGSGNFTFGYSFTPGTNLTVQAVRHYFGTKVSIWTDAGVLLAAQPVTSVPGTWVETPLAAPLQLSAGTRYRVACYTGNGGNYYYRSDLSTNFPNGIMNGSYDVVGDAFPTVLDGIRWWFVDLRYTLPAVPVSITPTISGNFTNGIWSGLVRVLSPATNIVLLADDGAGDYGASNPFHVVRSNQAPVIISPPANQTVRAGHGATFSANVYGTPAFTYQWRRDGTNVSNNGRISGATGPVLSISNVVASDAALYSVLVGNSFGNVLSASGALTVNPVDHFSWSPIPPTVSRLAPFAVSIQARDFLDNIATSFTSTVAVSAALAGGGTPVPVSPVTSGNFVAGVWNGSLSIPQLAANVVLRAQDGLGDFGLSAPFDVGQLVTFTLQPTNQNVQPGTNVTLAAAAVGVGPVRYQWRYEGTNILDATNASYSFANASLTNHGHYDVVATDDLASAASSNAFIFVLIRPGIILQPLPQQVVQGANAMFVCVATGAPPIFYRWLTNGVGMTTNTSGVFVFSNAQINLAVRANAVNNAGNVNSSTVTLTVLRDFDGDSMADFWETNYFGFSTNNAADGLLDFDGDGMSNHDEYVAGTNPTNALSVLKLVQSGTNANTLWFEAQTNKTYTVVCRTNLNGAPWTGVTNVFPSTSVRTIEVNSAVGPVLDLERYYRVLTPMNR